MKSWNKKKERKTFETIKVTNRKTERRIEKRKKKQKQKKEKRKKKTERGRELFLYCPCSTFLQISKILQFIFYTGVCISNNDNKSMSLNINIKHLKNVFARGWIDGNLFSQCTVTSVECCFENVLIKDKIILLGKMKNNFVVITWR